MNCHCDNPVTGDGRAKSEGPTRGLDNVIRAGFSPGDGTGVALVEDANLLSIDEEKLTGNGDFWLRERGSEVDRKLMVR